jgi:predicted esterase
LLVLVVGCGRSTVEAIPPDTAPIADVTIDAEDVRNAPSPTRTAGRFGAVFDPGGAAGLIVYMHGMGASPEDSCRYFEPAAIATHARLVCPRGNAKQSEGGAWIGNLDDKRYSLDQLMPVRPARSTLMGFSIGARVALQIALSESGKWSGLILMNQKLELSRAELVKAGIERVVLCAGEYDASYPVLYAEKQKLSRDNFPVRFVSLGPVGHHFASDMEAKMVDAITWVRGG